MSWLSEAAGGQRSTRLTPWRPHAAETGNSNSIALFFLSHHISVLLSQWIKKRKKNSRCIITYIWKKERGLMPYNKVANYVWAFFRWTMHVKKNVYLGCFAFMHEIKSENRFWQTNVSLFPICAYSCNHCEDLQSSDGQDYAGLSPVWAVW